VLLKQLIGTTVGAIAGPGVEAWLLEKMFVI